MITIQVCVGSSCFLRGATGVITAIQEIIHRHQLNARVALKGCFCLEKCTEGVTVAIDQQVFTGVRPEDITQLLAEELLLQPAREGETQR